MDAESSEASPLLSTKDTRSRTITLVIALIASVEAGSILQLVPVNQILERIICENAHQPASTCGENSDVQAETGIAPWLAIDIRLTSRSAQTPRRFLEGIKGLIRQRRNIDGNILWLFDGQTRTKSRSFTMYPWHRPQSAVLLGCL